MPKPVLPQIPNAGARAREQADAYKSVFASTQLRLDNGDIIEIPPHPQLRMLDDDRLEAYEELMFETESYDREPDIYIPEQNLPNGVTLPAETKRGQLLDPYRKDGQLVKPPHSVRVVRAVLGDETYAKLRAGGKCAGDVLRIWHEQNLRVNDRQQWDNKSNGAASDLVSVPG